MKLMILLALLLISCVELPTESQPIDGQSKWHKHTERPIPGDTTAIDLYSK